MLHRFTIPFIVAIATAATIPACSKKTQQDIGVYRDEATSALLKYGPQVSELSMKFADLATRVKALPDKLPGRADLDAMVAAQKANLTKLQDSISSYGDQVATAVKSGSKSEIEKVSSALVVQVQATLGDLGSGLKNIEARLDKLESDVKAMSATVDASAALPDAATAK